MNKVLKFLKDNYIRFTIYAFVGWIYEVTWLLIFRHEFENRGVLFGPYLPIYGFGMLILIFLLSKYKGKKHPLSDNVSGNIAVAVLSSFIYITIVEYTTPEKIYRIDEFAKGYGIGLLITIAVAILIRYLIVKKTKLKKIKGLDITPIVVILLIFIITTIIEYVSHYAIDVYFNKILWDYSKDFLNLNARVNFDASRNFAIGGAALMYFIEPLVFKITKSKNKYVNIIVIIVAVIMFIDAIYSFILK